MSSIDMKNKIEAVAETASPEERRTTLRRRLFVFFTHVYLIPLALVAVFPYTG